MIVTFIT